MFVFVFSCSQQTFHLLFFTVPGLLLQQLPTLSPSVSPLKSLETCSYWNFHKCKTTAATTATTHTLSYKMEYNRSLKFTHALCFLSRYESLQPLSYPTQMALQFTSIETRTVKSVSIRFCFPQARSSINLHTHTRFPSTISGTTF